jgi:hypothetical protein
MAQLKMFAEALQSEQTLQGNHFVLWGITQKGMDKTRNVNNPYFVHDQRNKAKVL